MSMLKDLMQGPWFVIIVLSFIVGGGIFSIVWSIIHSDDEDYKERCRRSNNRIGALMVNSNPKQLYGRNAARNHFYHSMWWNNRGPHDD